MSDDLPEEHRGNYISEVRGYDLLFAVVSPVVTPLLTSVRVMLDMVSGTALGEVPDLHDVEGDYDTYAGMLEYVGQYVEDHRDVLYPVDDTFIGMHAMSGKLLNGYLHLSVEEWPFEGQYAVTFHIRNTDTRDRIYQHLVGHGTNFLALTQEIDCFDEPRDCVVYATVLNTALENIMGKRHIVTGKPNLTVIVSNTANDA